MQVDGHCHCGDVAFEADVDPARVTICHCTDCQNLTGSAFRVTVPAALEAFRLLRGAPTVYVKVGSSGARREHAFCGRCGSPVWSRAVGNATSVGLRVGCLAQRDRLPPARQIWCRSALPWTVDLLEAPGSATE